jgi:hypothetical protein
MIEEVNLTASGLAGEENFLKVDKIGDILLDLGNFMEVHRK